jgi:transposase InsO family protein
LLLVKEESMPREAASALQLPLFVSESSVAQDVLTRYEAIRPVLTGERPLIQQSQQTGMNYWRLWRDLRRFQHAGLLGLVDRRTLPHTRGKPTAEALLPRSIQQHVVRLAIAHPFTARELARIVRECYHQPIDYRGIQRVLAQHHLSPDVLQRHRLRAQQAPTPPWPPEPPLGLPFEPTAHAQRLEQALGPEHLLIRFRTYREYPTEEQARWRIIELLEVGFRPRRIALLLAIDPHVVYYWQRRFKTGGLLGLSTRPRRRTSITSRVSVQVMMEVFQLLDNNPLLGHYRVKMALDSLGYRYGHTTVWQMVALYKQTHPPPRRATRLPNPDERPRQTTAPHQVWFADLRYLVKIDGQWLYSILIFDGHSRAIVGAGCFERQNLSRLSQVFRQAIAQWGAPDEVVSDHAKVFLALHPCLTHLGIRWSPITKGHPWQNLAEGGFGVQRRMLDAYVVGCTEREAVYRQHTRFVADYQFWGHWAHKRTDDQGRIFYLSPEVVRGRAHGRAVEPGRLQRTFRLRHRTRMVRTYGHIRLHNFGLYVDQGLWGQPVDVLIYDDAVRVEQADRLLVSYPCVYDAGRRRITSIDARGRQPYHQLQRLQLAFWSLDLLRFVWRMPPYQRRRWPHQGSVGRQISLFESFAN